jgi:apolipoprotein N-acyltransferase
MRFRLFGFIAATLGGILAAAAFPPADISSLIWISLVPLLFVLTQCRPMAALGYAFVFCLVFHSGIFSWMFQLPHYTFFHHLLLGLLLTIWFGAACLVVNLVARRFGILPALIAAPFAWVLYEWLRSNVGFLSLPWGLLAHSQASHTTLIQSATFIGTAGLTALIVAVNSILTVWAYPVLVNLSGSVSNPDLSPGRRGTICFALIVATCFLANIAYGYWGGRRISTTPGIRVAAVQPNVEQHRKWDETQRAAIMAVFESLSLSAGRRHPVLIIWPETATPQPISSNVDIYRQVASIADRTQASILLGSAQVQKFTPGAPETAEQKNSAYLIMPGKRLVQQRYAKMHLLPFGEYLPLAKWMPWHRLGISQASDFKAGRKAYVFSLKRFRFATPICWENIFPGIARAFVNNGAQFIVNITNEAWFGKSAAPYQFLAMNVFRAVENRRSVVRCANTGISCIIDPRGQVVDRVRDNAGSDIFVRGILEGQVALNDELTLYTLWGDWFVGLALAALVVLPVCCHLLGLRSHAQD